MKPDRLTLALAGSLALPLDKDTVHAISRSYGNVAHIVVLRCARNLCWKAWHTENRAVPRIQAELGWRVLEHVITKLVDRIAEKLVDDSHA